MGGAGGAEEGGEGGQPGEEEGLVGLQGEGRSYQGHVTLGGAGEEGGGEGGEVGGGGHREHTHCELGLNSHFVRIFSEINKVFFFSFTFNSIMLFTDCLLLELNLVNS